MSVAARHHVFYATVEWTGGTEKPAYAHVIRAAGRPDISGSTDAAFRGDGARYNPELLLVASISSCHMLAYLFLAARDGIKVARYRDEAEGTLMTDAKNGRMERVVLRPHVTISSGDTEAARALHEHAHRTCFIANSVNFPVDVEPVIEAA